MVEGMELFIGRLKLEVGAAAFTQQALRIGWQSLPTHGYVVTFLNITKIVG